MPMALVSVSPADKANGSPKQGDMIAVNPKNATDMWLVAREFFEANYEFVGPNSELDRNDPPNADKAQQGGKVAR